MLFNFSEVCSLKFFLWFVKESFLPGVEVARAVFCLFAYLAVSSVLYRLFDFFFFQVLKLLGLRKFGRPGPERPGDVKGGIARRKM